MSIVESAVPGVKIIAESVQSGSVVLLRLACQSLQLVQAIVGNVYSPLRAAKLSVT